jgi:death-on-curing protein
MGLLATVEKRKGERRYTIISRVLQSSAQPVAGAARWSGWFTRSRLVQPALGRPEQLSGYAETSDLIDMATAYTFGIVRNHLFAGGNKCTGLVVGILFLELNGHRFVASEEDAAKAVLKLADGTLKEADSNAFLRGNAVRKKK